jgi:hypothetical protein
MGEMNMNWSRHGLALKGFILLLALTLAFPAWSFGGEKKVRSNKATVQVGESTYRGAMLYVDRDLLVLKEGESGELLGFSFPEVDKVTIKKSKASIGLLVGLGIGVGLAALLVGSVKKEGDSLAALVVVPIVMAAAVVAGVLIAAVTSTAGGLIGLLVGKKKFKLAKMSPEKKEAALLKLRKFAVFQELPDELRSRVVMANSTN